MTAGGAAGSSRMVKLEEQKEEEEEKGGVGVMKTEEVQEEEEEEEDEEEEGVAVAGADIPAGSFSSPAPPALLAAEASSAAPTRALPLMQVWVRSGGRLEASGGRCGAGWAARIPLARDCQEQNLQLRRGGPESGGEPGASLVVVAVRHIRRGEPLRLWFAGDLALQLRLPFLSPANIQGEGRYVCLRCGRVFEAPNPLKVHLALRCGSLRKQRLWRRLSSGAGTAGGGLLPGTSRGEGAEASSSSFALFLARALPPPPPPPMGTPPLGLLPRSSAFTPVRPHHHPLFLGPCPATINPPPLLLHHHLPSSSSASSSSATTSSPHHPQAHVEALVSSLGRSKHGHLCLYCGKLYSRKYGLKIHLRTHTGYKPLKCKVCLRPFGDPSNLNKHVRLHAEGDTPYRCEHCGKVLVRRRDLERHIRSRHPQQSEEDVDADEDVSSSPKRQSSPSTLSVT